MKSRPSSLKKNRPSFDNSQLKNKSQQCTLSAALMSAPWPRRSSTNRPWPWAAATWSGDRPCPSGVVKSPVERLSKRPATAPWPPLHAKCNAVKPCSNRHCKKCLVIFLQYKSNLIDWVRFGPMVDPPWHQPSWEEDGQHSHRQSTRLNVMESGQLLRLIHEGLPCRINSSVFLIVHRLERVPTFLEQFLNDRCN